MTGSQWCLLLAAWLVPYAGAQEIPADGTEEESSTAVGRGQAEVSPADVYREVASIRTEIDLIRQQMGKPEIDPPAIRVEDAAPREVIFLAVAMFRKANRLSFEHTWERIEEPPVPKGQILPEHVLSTVNGALERVRAVKTNLGISEEVELLPLEPGRGDEDVFNAIVAANRELNGLLDNQVTPGDVYEQITVAIAYAARLLDGPGETSTPPEPPPFEARKRPADVYRKLILCFDDIHRIGEKSGIPMLSVTVDDERLESAAPGDVYDMASLLVSEFAHLHRMRADAAPPRKVYHPGRKVPADVYQRIGILVSQMEDLERRAEGNPGWLND